LFVLGVEALLEHFAPQTAPAWPSFKSEEMWLPWLARVSGTVTSGLMVMAATVVALYWLERLTAGWSRRRFIAFIVLVLAEAALSALKAEQWIDVIAGGLIGGTLSTIMFAMVLRFDLRVVPALIAVYLSMNVLADALQKQTPSAAVLGAISIASMLTLAWAVTNYLLRPMEIAAPEAAQPKPAE
jgi:hypothetical protein